MKKIFISTGEVSGDGLGAWYLKQQSDIYCEAVGGESLRASGAKLYKHVNELSLVGIWEIIKHIPFIFRFLKELSLYITKNSFDEVVLVDFPGFNLMLAKRLKKLKPSLRITYLSPPQLWVWGEKRVEKIKRYCDKVIVIYPFEVQWYENRGVNAVWLGYPFYEKVLPYFEASEEKEHKIAILPGSRKSETLKLFPYLIEAMALIKDKYSEVRFILPLAESFSEEFIIQCFENAALQGWHEYVEIVSGEEEKMMALSRCCLAISKPGTATLQIALLKVPTIIIYKTSSITYYLARLVIKVGHMGLVNLLLDKDVSPELIQSDCTSENILEEVSRIYNEFINDKDAYVKRLEKLGSLRQMLKNKG